ncbi:MULTISPECIES: serine hydrolase [unclassified Nonomuraea]|uniref:serine hydrolase n=1 Tax=unclassified Nonomuraea TaxID=2593643 RepID=UPI00340844E3
MAERIASGAFGWDTTLTITPELKSPGSGELRNRPDNSKVSVLEAAKLMISISDNTAADLLIHKAGRKNVERTAWAWGARDKRNMPLLTTRELFVLKGADYPRHTKKYLSLETTGQRMYLALSINDAGLALDKAQGPSVWFKGGSEPGVHDGVPVAIADNPTNLSLNCDYSPSWDG